MIFYKALSAGVDIEAGINIIHYFDPITLLLGSSVLVSYFL